MSADHSQKIAKSFSRLGWIGLWIQAVLAILPVAMLLYVLFGMTTGSRETLGFIDYVAFLGLALLGFTALWSYRYTRLGRRIADPARRPAWTSVIKTLWVGLWAGSAGIVISICLLVFEVTRLLILVLKAPQGGVPVMRTEIDSRTYWISAIDIVTLLAELCTLVGELLVVGLTLWLLFQVTRYSVGFDQSPLSGDAKSKS
ncbi:DUF3611 family protein [Planctomicrobium piriforme]|uniref:DUF3611 family protein n=1 Tax=Planctomicrobium piriforme TaxID=1576369 RepID=A0A1I3FH96_9PLAN|nr:DUF3611 family protein [Planctomicrobium piriforme]SFI10472.1 Protein of unknown function [Planctomicrobium piriforme]